MKTIRHILTWCLQLFSSTVLYAQSFTLSGVVSDEDGNGIELATVSCLEQGAVTVANLKGEYSLNLKSADSVVVKFSMIGFQTRTRVLRRPKGKQRLLVTLHPMESLDEVVVTEKRRQTTGTDQLDTKNLRNSPSTTGNAVEELVQQQAGVSTHNELSSQYNVRGGSFDENSVYINGTEIYRPLLIRSGQQEGLSVINSDMVEKIGFSSGGFEAKYGDKMSSALDIQYRKPTRLEGNVQVSLLGASVFMGYGNKKFSMSHGVRYKTNRYLLGSLETKGEYRPNFLDYQTYITWSPNKRWDLEVIGNISENHYNFKPSDRETSFGKNPCEVTGGSLPYQRAGDLRHTGTILAGRHADTGESGRGHLHGTCTKLFDSQCGQSETDSQPSSETTQHGGWTDHEMGRHRRKCTRI